MKDCPCSRNGGNCCELDEHEVAFGQQSHLAEIDGLGCGQSHLLLASIRAIALKAELRLNRAHCISAASTHMSPMDQTSISEREARPCCFVMP